MCDELNYDCLDALLPRYLRRVWRLTDTDIETETKSASDEVRDTETETETELHITTISSKELKVLHKVLCSANLLDRETETETNRESAVSRKTHSFVALPGCCKLTQFLSNYKELGLFPMDIASSLAVCALDLPSDAPCRVLDLCCCPGAKLRMISDSLHANSVVVGVDISEKRLHVCKALLESWEELLFRRKRQSPRQLLFCCDGSTFGSDDNLGVLAFDSLILLNDIKHSKDSKKRNNKSGKGREAKRLKVTQNILSGVSKIDELSADLQESKPMHCADSDEAVTFVDVRVFDYVLVDAECTHDASYRHMKYIAKCHKWDEAKESVSHPTLALSHNIRDTKTSSEGRRLLQQTQRSLIENGFNRLAPGGTMVYSTCSSEVEQNEDIVKWLLDTHADAVMDDAGAAISKYFALDFVNPLRMKIDLNASVSEEESITFCKYVCSLSAIFVEHGSIAGTIRVGLKSGMSGHFVARVLKKQQQ